MGRGIRRGDAASSRAERCHVYKRCGVDSFPGTGAVPGKRGPTRETGAKGLGRGNAKTFGFFAAPGKKRRRRRWGGGVYVVEEGGATPSVFAARPRVLTRTKQPRALYAGLVRRQRRARGRVSRGARPGQARERRGVRPGGRRTTDSSGIRAARGVATVASAQCGGGERGYRRKRKRRRCNRGFHKRRGCFCSAHARFHPRKASGGVLRRVGRRRGRRRRHPKGAGYRRRDDDGSGVPVAAGRGRANRRRGPNSRGGARSGGSHRSRGGRGSNSAGRRGGSGGSRGACRGRASSR